MLPDLSIINVERSIPIYFLPYIDFSFQTSNSSASLCSESDSRIKFKLCFSLKDLYANDLINGLCTELGEMDFYEKQAKKAFKKGYNYYVVSSEKGKNREQSWSIMSKQALEHHKKEHDIYFIAEKDKNSFDFVV